MADNEHMSGRAPSLINGMPSHGIPLITRTGKASVQSAGHSNTQQISGIALLKTFDFRCEQLLILARQPLFTTVLLVFLSLPQHYSQILPTLDHLL
ncbi:protein of unknown function [Candidatus Methylomirabilis oxygeniifera]|uniref:Uncharacterized protein n=1 Tax=Methylomirabilis oxygeniifera TaxID=671143 RepID=D5MGU8_METO1|nr:protein of unknown function [Candidatus Methylomirabilis oxyfera]